MAAEEVAAGAGAAEGGGAGVGEARPGSGAGKGGEEVDIAKAAVENGLGGPEVGRLDVPVGDGSEPAGEDKASERAPSSRSNRSDKTASKASNHADGDGAKGEGDVAVKRMPPAGVESVFLTGTTLKILEIDEERLRAGDIASITIEKKVLVDDIQFRGAISDFHTYKGKIQKYSGDKLLLRYNAKDIYGDGNNFEVCLTLEAKDAFEKAEEKAKREHEEAQALQAAEDERRRLESKLRGWVSLGSEKEIEEGRVRDSREPIVMSISRRRREFNAPYKFSDKDSQELWNSSACECRPFKDPNFDLRLLSCRGQPRNSCTQYVAREMDDTEAAAHLDSYAMREFLATVQERCHYALGQNGAVDILADSFAGLADDEGTGGEHAKARSAIAENQSFTELQYSKGRLLSAIDWMPNRKGMVAVSCTEAAALDERIELVTGRFKPSALLLWNFIDPIHPQLVLESPSDVYAFRFHPTRPEIVAAGCYNGQANHMLHQRCNITVLLWDLTSAIESLRRREKKRGGGGGGGGAGGEGGGEGGDGAGGNKAIPVVKPVAISQLESSHRTCITDLAWLPEHLELNSKGRLVRLTGKEPTSPTTPSAAAAPSPTAASPTVPSTPSATASQWSSSECFATTSADGTVMFWDSKILRKVQSNPNTANKTDSAAAPAWTPVYTLPLVRTEGAGAVAATKFNFSNTIPMPKAPPVTFCVGSEPGDLHLLPLERPSTATTPAAGDFGDGIMEGSTGAGAHAAPVTALDRSPFFDNVLLSVGDWSFKVWQEDAHAYKHALIPVFVSPNADAYCTAGVWSPTRPGVAYIALADGTLQVWDLLDRSHEPSMTTTVSSVALVSLSFPRGPSSSTSGPQLLAVGDAAGTLHVLELPRNLRRPISNEATRGAGMAAEPALDESGTFSIGAGGIGDLRAESPEVKVVYDERAEKEYQQMEREFRVGLVASSRKDDRTER
eukprot:jgi/Chlat1/2737/Chrsp182S02893